MFKDLKIKNLKIIILLVCYLIVFYFLIFKNILKLVEIKELIEQEDIKIGRLNYEKNTVLKALTLKKENFEKEQKKIVKNEEDETKKSFDNIPSLFRYIEDKITKNNINFQNFGRSRREEDKLNLTMTFKGKEKDVKNFFSDIENEDYDINFSSSYLKITVDKSLLEVKSNLVATVLDKKEEVEIDTNIEDKNIFILGIGELAQDILTLLSKEQLKNIYITNRTYHKAEQIKKQFEMVNIIDYKEKYKEMFEADVIISATSAPHIVVEYDKFVPKMREDKDYLFIDLAVPRDVDERLANFKNIEIYNLDDIWKVYNEHSMNRDKLLEDYSYLIDEQMEKLIKSLDYYKENSL